MVGEQSINLSYDRCRNKYAKCKDQSNGELDDKTWQAFGNKGKLNSIAFWIGREECPQRKEVLYANWKL